MIVPLVFPRAVQVSRLLKSLSANGWDSTVVWRDVPDAVRDPELERIYRHDFTALHADPDAEGRWAGWRRRLFRRPAVDEEADWIEAGTRTAAEALRQGRFSALVSFAQPWSDHLIGLRLRKAFRLPWIVHFSDPWVDSPYYESLPAALLAEWRVQEHDVIERADAIVFVTEETAELVMRKYPRPWRVKVQVIPHGYDRALLALLPAETRPRQRMRIVHTGDFFAGKRTPSALLHALSRLRAKYLGDELMEVRFVGSTPAQYVREAEQLSLGAMVRFQPRMPFLASLRAAQEADLLLVVDAPADKSVFLPSKLVEYLIWRKPILGLTSPDGASARLLRRLGCPLVPPDDPAAIAACLEQSLLDWRSGALQVAPQFDDAAAAYDIGTTAAQFAALLEATCGMGART
jgi:glycosyltransferase involved in cell wall biosynthesis